MTNGRTDNPEAICPSNFFEVGGIIKVLGKDEDDGSDVKYSVIKTDPTQVTYSTLPSLDSLSSPAPLHIDMLVRPRTHTGPS